MRRRSGGEAGWLTRCFGARGAAADVLVWTVTEFQSRLHVVASLAATVMGEGRVLDAA